jgi:glycosyltransferase involved in cell wall biosynthesis
VLSLIRGLDKNKYNIFLACPPKGVRIPEFVSAGANVKEVRLRHFYDLFSVIKLIKIIITENIHIIHSHLSQSDFLACIAAKLTNRPIVSTIHGVIIREFESLSKKKFYHFLHRLTALFLDELIAVSEGAKEDLLAHEAINESRISVIYSGIDPEKFSKPDISTVKPEFGIDERAKVVGIVATLTPEKNHSVFLKAAAQILTQKPDVKFLIVGDGPLKKQLQNLATQLGINSNVIFTGERRDIPNILSSLDIIVLPSSTEGLPIVLLEGMSAGVPIVASRVGGVPEVVEDEETGILIPPRKSKELAKAIIRLLDNSQLAEMFKNRGRKKIEKKFALNVMIEKTQECYDRLLHSI